MHEINASILQRFLISSILFLFFNASLIEKCEALRIKIKVLNFVNDINILAYDRFIKAIVTSVSRLKKAEALINSQSTLASTLRIN